jgi:PAS domain S-box-containing protein
VGSSNKRPSWHHYAVAVISVALSLAIGLHFRPSTYSTPYLFFYPAVLIALWYGGFRTGTFATLLTAAIVDWFLLPPYGTTTFNPTNLLRGFFFCVSFGLICWLIDARKVRAEAEIERQIRLLNITFEPIIVRDAQDKIVFWNKGAERLYGWTEAEAVGRHIHDLLKTVFSKSLTAIQSDLARNGHWHGELEHTRKDGTNVLVESWWTQEQVNGRQTAVMEANFDLTARRLAEKVWVQSEKLASVGRLAATIAHEVNNPLAAAMNSVYLASSEATLSPQAREILKIADLQLRRAAHITAQTLSFSRTDGVRKPLELPEIIDEVVDVYVGKLKDRRINVQKRFRCGPCGEDCDFCFYGNAGELRQLVSNLLGNGIDALRDGGTLHVRLCRTSGLRGECVRLTIADNGCGIRTENLKRIFEPFFTTKESVGTGLGLWVTEQIIRKYNGSIRVRSQAGKGTVFSLSIPAMAAETSGNSFLTGSA